MDNDLERFEDEFSYELREIIQLYQSQPVPCPTYSETTNLLKQLTVEETRVHVTKPRRFQLLQITWHVIHWRFLLVGPWFWISSLLLLSAGIIAAPFLQRSEIISLLLFFLPMVTLCNVVYSIRTLSTGLREVETSCPTDFVEVMTGCALAVMGFHMAVGALATLAIALANWAPFHIVLITWLGPMLLLVGLCVPIVLRWGTLKAMIVGCCPWIIISFYAFFLEKGHNHTLLFLLPNTALQSTCYLIAGGVGLALLGMLFCQGSKAYNLLLVKPEL